MINLDKESYFKKNISDANIPYRLMKIKFLDDFINLLNPGGRIVIISYHSVEDRIVKHKLKELKHKKEIELIYKKPLIPSKEEVSINKRSRSAKMRVGEKIG